MAKYKQNLEVIFAKNPLWSKVRDILSQCQKHGFFCVIAGGAVRDALLGKVPKDFDIATSTDPQKLLKVFKQARWVGKSFGVLHLPLGKNKYVEIASFRKDGPYKDGRRPKFVEFCNIEQDALRRDFTMNALYYDVEKQEVLDWVQGIQDIQGQKIRTVGNPEKRFEEDKLRLLRAIRFAVVFDFYLEPKTFESVKTLMPDIQHIAKERILDEIEKIFVSEKFSKMIEFFKSTNLFQILWPKWPQPKKQDYIFWQNISILHNKPSFYWWTLIFFPFVWTLNPFLKKPQQAFTSEFQKTKICFRENLKKMDFYKHIRLSKEVERLITRFYLFYLEMNSNTSKHSVLNRGKKLYLLHQYPPHYLELLKTITQNQNLLTELKDIEDEKRQRFPHSTLPKPYLTGRDLHFIKIKKDKISKALKYSYIQQLTSQVSSKDQALKKVQSADETVLNGCDWT